MGSPFDGDRIELGDVTLEAPADPRRSPSTSLAERLDRATAEHVPGPR